MTKLTNDDCNRDEKALYELHIDLMNGANLSEAYSIVDDLWDIGVVTLEQAEQWKQDLGRCPEGYELHLGARSWCAYCGSIYWHECDNCQVIKDSRSSKEDYLFMEAQAIHGAGLTSEVFCRLCWRHITLSDPYNRYGISALGDSEGVYLCSCGSTIRSNRPPHSPIICAHCYFSEKGRQLGEKYLVHTIS